jgi:hypothetical protein
MRIRLGAMAIMSGVALGITGVAGAVPALANQTNKVFYITDANTGTDWYMYQEGADPIEVYDDIGGAATFQDINGATWDYNGNDRPVYEWELMGTNDCWTNVGGSVDLETCVSGDTDQLFWSQNTDYGSLMVSEGVTGSGSDQCVNVSHAESGGPVNIIGCKSEGADGWFDQYWHTETY